MGRPGRRSVGPVRVAGELHGCELTPPLGDPERYPVKSRKLKRSERENWWLWLVWREQVWLQQMPDKGVWAGLWTLPLLDGDEAVNALLDEVLGKSLSERVERQPRMKHVLTHLDWWLHARRVVVDDAEAVHLSVALRAQAPSGQWVPLADLANWGLPAPLRRLLVG